jgi:hypothetical protein
MQLFWFERQNLQLAQVLIFAAVCSTHASSEHSYFTSWCQNFARRLWKSNREGDGGTRVTSRLTRGSGK